MSNLNDLAPDTFSAEALPLPADKQPDAEMREVILKFEEIFAELQPHTGERAAVAAPSMYVDFPDDIVKVLTELGPRDVTVPVQPRDRREPELATKPGVEVKGSETSMPGQNVNFDLKLDLDEAIAILREAEVRGKAPAARATHEGKEAESPLTIARSPADPRSKRVTQPPIAPKVAAPTNTSKLAQPMVTPKAAEPAATAVSPEGSSKSRTLWSLALIAGSLALVVGTGVGYLMGRNHDHEATTSSAKIDSSPEGGTKLRADYDLRRR